MKKLKILIFGLGSIGQRHVNLIRAHYPHEMVAFRTHEGQGNNPFSLRELHTWAEVDQERFDVAMITNPTFLHLNTASECAKRNMHLFIEKPIDIKTEGLEELIQLVSKKNLTAYVAYPFRFHPVIQSLKQKLRNQRILHSRAVCVSYLPRWRSQQNHKVSYSSFHDQGGGVVLDLSHEIDYLEYLFGEIQDIQGLCGRKSNVTVDAEDFCDLNVSHPCGVTNLHMNLFSAKNQRFLEIDTEETYIKGDLYACEITFQSLEAKEISVISFNNDPDAMYVAQMEYFFSHLGAVNIENNLEVAAKLFRKVVQFRSGKEYSYNSLR